MLADTADEHEWLFGVRREGLFFSGLTLAYKAASGLGGLMAGLALDAIHFPTNLAAQGTSIAISNEVLHMLALISGPLPAGTRRARTSFYSDITLRAKACADHRGSRAAKRKEGGGIHVNASCKYSWR